MVAVAGRLLLTLPLPIPYNGAIRRGRYGGYPAVEYGEWLNLVHPKIEISCEEQGWECIRTGGIEVSMVFRLPKRPGDEDGYVKSILDALGGANAERKVSSRGNVSFGRVNHDEPAVYDNDKRVRGHKTWVESTHNTEPTVAIEVTLCEPPPNMAVILKNEDNRLKKLAKKGAA